MPQAVHNPQDPSGAHPLPSHRLSQKVRQMRRGLLHQSRLHDPPQDPQHRGRGRGGVPLRGVRQDAKEQVHPVAARQVCAQAKGRKSG